MHADFLTPTSPRTSESCDKHELHLHLRITLENGTSELMSTEEWVFVNHFKTHKFLFVACAFKFYFNAHKNCSYENWSFWFTSVVLTLGRQRVSLQSHSEVWRETLPQRYILKRKHKIKMKWLLSIECLVILCNAKQGLHEFSKELTRVCKTNKSQIIKKKEILG